MKPVMVVLAGPDGAGKSTLFETRVAPRFAGPVVNAALIQRHELSDPSPEGAYGAAQIASHRRDTLMAQRKSFATETVVSHPSKLELAMRARDLGYDIVVLHSGVDQADLSVERVRQRVREGGHTVPEQRIRDCYDRNGPLIRAAVLASTRGLVFDNPMVNQPPERIIAFANGGVVFVRPHVPAWARAVSGEGLR